MLSQADEFIPDIQCTCWHVIMELKVDQIVRKYHTKIDKTQTVHNSYHVDSNKSVLSCCFEDKCKNVLSIF